MPTIKIKATGEVVEAEKGSCIFGITIYVVDVSENFLMGTVARKYYIEDEIERIK